MCSVCSVHQGAVVAGLCSLFSVHQGAVVAELMLKHARYSECRDVSGFQAELTEIVDTFREQTISLGKVGRLSLLAIC